MKKVRNFNFVYVILFIAIFISFVAMCFSDRNTFSILLKGLFDKQYIADYFSRTDIIQFQNVAPTFENLVKAQLYEYQLTGFTYDATIIFATAHMQIFLPFTALIGGIKFYNLYHHLMKFQFSKKRNNSYRKNINKVMISNGIMVSIAMYAAYALIVIIMYPISGGELGATGRSLFSDLLGNDLYVNDTMMYFLLEGLVSYFLIPFVYTYFCESIVLLGLNLKVVIGAPLAYYFGLSALGYALYNFVPSIAIYLNPSVIMASGTYNFNTILMILINCVPLFIGIGITWVKTQHVEL